MAPASEGRGLLARMRSGSNGTLRSCRTVPIAIMALFLLGGGLLFAWLRSQTSSPAVQLMRCYNQPPVDEVAATYDGFLKGVPASLTLHKVIWSAHRSPINLTVVSFGSVAKLEALEAMCATWDGPMSVAVYVALEADALGNLVPNATRLLQDAEDRAEQFFQRSEERVAETNAGCRLQLLLLTEKIRSRPEDSPDGVMFTLFPINSMRNAALLAATTPLVLVVDSDMLLSRSMSLKMADEQHFIFLSSLTNSKIAIIVPAFETDQSLGITDGQQLAATLVAGNKTGIKESVQAKEVYPFAQNIFAEGHRCVKSEKWYATDRHYTTDYTERCEPWFIINRYINPMYDVRFRGYGWNKVQHASSVAFTGFKLEVAPSFFMVHRPHMPSKALKLFWSQKNEQGSIWRKVEDLFKEVQRALVKGNFKPKADAATKHCLEALPWWAGPHSGPRTSGVSR